MKTINLRLSVVLLVPIAFGCGQREFVGQSESPFPDETLTDVATYATQLSNVLILSERQLPVPDHVVQRGEGYVGRRVRARVVGTPWASPHTSERAPQEIEITVAGWVYKSGDLIPFTIASSPRIEVGESTGSRC